MAYLGKYIRQILSKQETVILPGFGSLLFSKSKGIKGDDDKIDPPGKIIVFDAKHPKEDGKLANEYAEGEGIELEEARQQILELVDAIKFKLDKGEKYILELVGSFSRDDANKIHFQKDPNWVIDPELFGLSSLDLLELESDEPEEIIVESKPDIKANKKAVKEQKDSVKAQRKPANKWKIIWIVIGSLIAVLVLILLIPSGNGIEFGKDGIVIRENDGQATIATKEIVLDKNDSDLGEVNILEEEEETAKEPTIVIDQKNYYIIAGSFQSLANATVLLEDLKAAGFPAEIILTENRLYRVSVKSYDTKQKALLELEQIKGEDGLSKVWLLTR